MANLVFGLNQSLDGYVDHQEFAPGPSLFRHFQQVRDLAGSVYGRRMYEVMRYWDEDHPEWDAEERDFAAAWRSRPKWVGSRSSVGPNATLVKDDVEAVIRGLKAQLVGLRYKSVFALFAGNAAGIEPVRHLMTGAMGSFPGGHRGSDRTQPADVDKRRPATCIDRRVSLTDERG